MREDNIDDVFGHNRSALGNLTNRPLKRKLSSILSDSGIKTRDGCGKPVDGKDEESRCPKHVRLQAAEYVKENCERSCGENCNSMGLSRFSTEQLESACSPASSEGDTVLFEIAKETVQCNLPNDEAHPEQEDEHRITDSETLGLPCLPTSVVPTCPEDDKEDCPGFMINNADNEAAVDHVSRHGEKDIGIGKIGSSNLDSTQWSRLPISEGSKSLALERCSGFKTDNCANLGMYDDLLKTCSCSFCLKASYIWSDLHYQDIKGRISALKKSQKDASILAQKSSKEKETYHDQGNSSKSKLEFDLCGQWMSLFRHMEDMFAHEGSQLQTSFVTLKDLREDCKMNLEMLNGMPMEKH
ncbi:uncharacterized protein LOC111804093 [Cucurbita pepo subsp. pepo]|uniref:uncharacterized protein LOC111804093 n=1 Tax=Cucurbita pepo subsp. pepo TaxID=3664 RepID=UPI000C9D7868|nr:uncharacterized protein LOC111804093 [Cucurbita pepo subsp. pepo]